jgi:hypothetical protein
MRRALLKGTTVAVVLAGALLAGSPDCRLPGGPGLQANAWAEDAWRTEFDDVCSRTSDAMNFTVAELKLLVERCDKLKPQIEALEPSARKVFLKRLQMCCDLYRYVLESKKVEPAKQ